MSQTDYDDIDEQPENENPNVRQMRDRIKTLEAENAANAALATENAALKRDSAIRDADLKLNDAQRVALDAVHKGEWNADQLRATAESLGFVQPVPDTPESEVAAHQQVQNAAQGGITQLPDRDAELDAKLDQAANPDEFMRLYAETGRPVRQ